MSLEGRTSEEIQALAELADSLGNNPNTRRGLLELSKRANPNLSIPEIDIPNSMLPTVQKMQERLDAAEKREADRQARERIIESRKKAIEKGISEDKMPELEKLMVEKSIPDHATAAEYMKMQQQTAAPTSASSQSKTFGRPVMPDLKAFGGSLKDFGRAQAYAAIDELRGRKSA